MFSDSERDKWHTLQVIVAEAMNKCFRNQLEAKPMATEMVRRDRRFDNDGDPADLVQQQFDYERGGRRPLFGDGGQRFSPTGRRY